MRKLCANKPLWMMMTYAMMQEDWIDYKRVQQQRAKEGTFYVAEDGGANDWMRYLFEDVPLSDD